jgi:ribonuclease-3
MSRLYLEIKVSTLSYVISHMFDFNNTRNHRFTETHFAQIVEEGLHLPPVCVKNIHVYQWAFIPHVPTEVLNQHDRFDLAGRTLLNDSVMQFFLKAYPHTKAADVQCMHETWLTTTHLASISEQLGLPRHACLATEQERTNERQNSRLHVKLLRAFIGVLHEDLSSTTVHTLLYALWKCFPVENELKSAKDRLTKYFQKHYHIAPIFTHTHSGPSNVPIYSASVCNVPGTVVIGKGTGRTKKEANNHAACQALGYLNGV